MAVAAVVFDVDGTLVDHDHAQRAGLAGHLADRGEYLNDVTWARWRHLEERHFARFLARELTFQGQRRARVRDFTGEPLDDAAADAWFDAYRIRFEHAWRLFDDVVDTLDALGHLTLAAFSNVSGAYTRHKLAAMGLTERFAVAWGTDDVGGAKPEPRTYSAVLAEIGVAAAQALHVGDRYESDARGPHRAGLTGVWLNRPGAESLGRLPSGDPDPGIPVIGTLRELPALAGC